SESLSGPLNMNGVRLDGERIQWDDAEQLSDPGLGPEGEDKETYVQAGDTLTVELDIESLDDVDIFGIRATSTTTDEGSIKAVSDNPEEPEEPEEDLTFEKVFFTDTFNEDDVPVGGAAILAEEPEPNTFNNLFLPEGTEPTFDNYVSYYESIGGDVTGLEGVVFYNNDEEGALQEVYRLDPPEGGFETADQLLSLYDQAVENGAFDSAVGEDGSLDLMAALSMGEEIAYDVPPEEEVIEDDIEIA
ncbi:hypothetical protein AB9K41_19915, partial [Cribrihabitans sp. XS_ASV171]